jgi:hypothetical protein
MAHVTAEGSIEFPGSAPLVYGLLADYRQGHPSILPRRYFTDLTVEQGGQGAGTVIRYGVKLGGRVQQARAKIFEPQPGRVLEERVLDARGTVTTFTVDPLKGGRVRVTIRTSWQASGVAGLFERLLAPGMLRRIYREELANLERVARG